MTEIELLLDLFSRVDEHVHDAVDGLNTEQLHFAPARDANTIGWLVWHLTRVQDDHIAEILERSQVWSEGDWPRRFGCPDGYDDTGYGHSPHEMLAVRPESGDALIEYYEAVAARTRQLLDSLDAAALDRVVDRRFKPPVTLGVRLISIADDDIQHAGQANYVRGIVDRQ